MSPKDWATAEAELQSPWGLVELQCDQFKLALQVARVRNLQYTLTVFVDGYFTGVWCNAQHPCEEQRRFMRPRSFAAYKPTELQRMKSLFSAKQLREMAAKRITFYAADWPSFKPLRRHLMANNQVITLLRPRPETQEPS